MANLVQKRDELQAQVATGELTAPEAKAELDMTLSTGEGAAVAAQDQATAREWQTTSEQAIDATAQAATAQAAVPVAPAPSAARGAIAPLILGAIGAGAGYVAAEGDGKAQTTYATVGGVVGLVAGFIVNKVRQRRAASSVVATEAVASAPAPATPATAPVPGVSGLWY